MAGLVRGDLLALAIILLVVAAVFYWALPIGYPLLYIGAVALVGGLLVLGYWIYRQARGS